VNGGGELKTEGPDIFARVPASVMPPEWRMQRSGDERYNPDWRLDSNLDHPLERRVWLEDSDQDHPLVNQRIRSGFPTGSAASVALVDWSALHNVATLFDAPSDIRDPFTAILDLATVVTALVFYDRIVCLDYGGVSTRVADHFALSDVLFGIDPGPAGAGGPGSIHDMIEDYFVEAKKEFCRAAQDGEGWLSRLAANWQHLLPAVRLVTRPMSR
jgi:hypothetical protein